MERPPISAVGILAFGLGGLFTPGLRAATDKPTCKVIVNAANPETTISTERLSSIFLKNVTKWDNGTPALPVDQSLTSPARIAFSKEVFDQPVVAIQAYWQEEIAKGREGPPPVKASDQEVTAFVAENPGAIGYVAAATTLPGSTKVLKLTH
ncbi:MAG TPA: substrate-binding domain-containing protein [Vicinamibacteria bacterium]|jgi:ABC-type phosphate transport system substrate-binding protein|nr:substrate-binding domain-containing protein [Vicinamibacteria bacterium]